MTTKPKARKFRIRKTSPLSNGPSPEKVDSKAPDSDGFGKMPFPGSAAADAKDASVEADAPKKTAASAQPAPGPTDIADIRAEGLTGRQLRMAQRLAQKHGLSAESEFDAVRQLRLTGIDPFDRTNMLELVMPEATETDPSQAAPRTQLPQRIETQRLPSTEINPSRADMEGRRSAQIREIQRDIARRRRRKLLLLATRLAFFVALPTFIAGWYYYVVATPMYATKTEFVIQQADSAGGGGIGSLFGGTGFATSQDSITVQSYLTSRDAMLRLNEDAGFKAHFSQDFIDPIQRLAKDTTNERAYATFTDNVKIGYDPTEGIVKMEVIAADPETSAEYSRRLIDYAEERVDDLTQRLREDQMSGARESFEEAEEKMLAAQARVLELQEQLGVLDPAAESGAIMSQVGTFETQLQEKRLELAQLLSNRRPNEARVAGVEGDIRRLQTLVAALRGQMTDGSSDAASLAGVSAQLRLAETDLQTRTALMQQALQQLEGARIEANRQVRYLSLGVTPVAPDEATYPRSFENTLLAFLVFAGLYLMISLTASILREQVSG